MRISGLEAINLRTVLGNISKAGKIGELKEIEGSDP